MEWCGQETAPQPAMACPAGLHTMLSVDEVEHEYESLAQNLIFFKTIRATKRCNSQVYG